MFVVIGVIEAALNLDFFVLSLTSSGRTTDHQSGHSVPDLGEERHV